RPREDRPRDAKPRHEPQQQRRKESRDRRHSPSGDVPDSDGFHAGNMPAFLSRPVRSASN
ncbi:MAG: DEAD/DEAH box helicase, partial [Pseudomonadota bacterium]